MRRMRLALGLLMALMLPAGPVAASSSPVDIRDIAIPLNPCGLVGDALQPTAGGGYVEVASHCEVEDEMLSGWVNVRVIAIDGSTITEQRAPIQRTGVRQEDSSDGGSTFHTYVYGIGGWTTVSSP
jgi:hypothetical protein